MFSGPGDRDSFGDYDIGTASSAPGRSSPYTAIEHACFSMYEKLRDLRAQPDSPHRLEQVAHLVKTITQNHADEWLLILESLELVKQSKPNETQQSLVRQCFDCLNANQNRYGDKTIELIDKGVLLASER